MYIVQTQSFHSTLFSGPKIYHSVCRIGIGCGTLSTNISRQLSNIGAITIFRQLRQSHRAQVYTDHWKRIANYTSDIIPTPPREQYLKLYTKCQHSSVPPVLIVGIFTTLPDFYSTLLLYYSAVNKKTITDTCHWFINTEVTILDQFLTLFRLVTVLKRLELQFGVNLMLMGKLTSKLKFARFT